ncbi:MAG: hypothetical protein IJC73_05945 [Lentisphaeria bacterium]|nr:hypothetical protein [Lentisphaeria bacterium]
MNALFDAIAGMISGFCNGFSVIWNYGPSVFWMILIYWLLALWIGSGCFAATVAEMFHHPVWRHFLLGLALPYWYPIHLAKSIQTNMETAEELQKLQEEAMEEERRNELGERMSELRNQRDQERFERIAARAGMSREEFDAQEAARRQQEADEAARQAAAEAEAARVAAEIAEAGRPIYELLFAQPADENGVRRGPFLLSMRDGSEVMIDEVRSLNDAFMLCVVSVTGKAVRIRYENIAGVSSYE